jgi:hypothetical protein
MVDIGEIVPLSGFPAIVIDHGKELVLALLERVLALARHRQHLSPNLQVNGKINPFHHLQSQRERALGI